MLIIGIGVVEVSVGDDEGDDGGEDVGVVDWVIVYGRVMVIM